MLEDEGSGETNSWFVYRNTEGMRIRGTYTIGEGGLLSVDTEDAEVTQVSIGDVMATLARKGDRVQIAWASVENNGFVSIFSNGLSEEEIIQVAKNVEY